MDDDPIPTPHDLPNKPLGEAIFELKWSLINKARGIHHDPGFRILLGRYYDRLRKDYPYVRELPASQMPEDMTPYIVHHQFRPAEDGWPLTQIGPGIITVNDNEGYKWSGFRPRVLSAIEALFESYPTDIQQLEPVGAQLTYINGLSFDTTKDSLTRFLRDYLHIGLMVDPRLFDQATKADKPSALDLSITFPLEELPGVGLLRFATGTKHQEPAVIWQIVIRTADSKVPKDTNSLATWIDDAHDVVHRWFFTLSRGKLLKTFEAQNGNGSA